MIRLAIVGYGNLGKGVEAAVRQNPDMELVAVFTRRDPESVKLLTAGVPVLPLAALDKLAESLDLPRGISQSDLRKCVSILLTAEELQALVLRLTSS